MQVATDAPRDNLTETQVVALINGVAVQVDPGLEILDQNDTVLADRSETLVWDGGSVAWEARGVTHRRARLMVTEPVDVGAHRFRPYVTLSDQNVSARFDLGVFVPVSAERSYTDDLGEILAVDGLDKLALLNTPIGSTYRIASGATYLDEVETLIAAIDPDVSPVILQDGDQGATTLPADRIWELGDEHTYLSVANGLLYAVGYRELWVDHNGCYRLQQYVSPSERLGEWSYDFGSASTAATDRTEQSDWFDVPNRWVFVRDRPYVGVADTATDGSGGLYVVTNTSDGESSSDQRGGIVRRRIVRVDAADQTGLVDQADRIVADDKRVTRTRRLTVEPNPLHGHHDVVDIVDEILGTGKGLVRGWDMPLNGDPMRLTVEMI